MLEQETLVLVVGGLGRVIRPSKRGRAVGYDVLAPGDMGPTPYTRFYEERQLRVARIGDTVCEHPLGQHSCGLRHLWPHDLERVKQSGQ